MPLGDQNADDGGGPVHARLAPPPALRRPQPDIPADQPVGQNI